MIDTYRVWLNLAKRIASEHIPGGRLQGGGHDNELRGRRGAKSAALMVQLYGYVLYCILACFELARISVGRSMASNEGGNEIAQLAQPLDWKRDERLGRTRNDGKRESCRRQEDIRTK